MSLLAQGKLIRVQPQSPSPAALSTGISHMFFGDEINVLIFESFQNFGSPTYFEYYLQQYDYNLNLLKEEPIKRLDYPDTIFSHEEVFAGFLSNNSGFYIYISGINGVSEKSLLEVRDSSGTKVFSKIDYELLDEPKLTKSVNYIEDFALLKNNKLYQVSKSGMDLASFDRDSLESEILSKHFPNFDSLHLEARFASNLSANNNAFHVNLYQAGNQFIYYCKFDINFQLLDSISGSAIRNKYRIHNHQGELLLLSDSIVIDSSANTFQANYYCSDFDLNLSFSFQTSGRIAYGYFGPTNADEPIFMFDGSLNLVNSESFIKPLDTVVGSRFRHYRNGNKVLDHMIYKDGVPGGPTNIAVSSLFGRSMNNEFFVPIIAYYGGSLLIYRSYLLKIDSLGNSPLSVNLITESKVVEVYPNPSKNWIKVKTYEQGENFSIRIFNLQGQIVFDQDAISERQINISELPPGTFFMQLEGEKGAWLNTYQFIKH